MGSEQPARRRRPHKRSRNGCLTCKQRHIRCDEQKPVCTNCLVRGGECGYADLAVASSSSTRAASTGADTPLRQTQQQLYKTLRSTPVDPFDVLPIAMPHKSLDLFHHFTHYRILTRTAVQKNPNSSCVALALQDPANFRASLLLSAMHYFWLNGSLGDMEETYLYHKVESMRLVNEHLGDPIGSTSDSCIYLIAALALAESGMGDINAAEAHFNGLFTLLDMKRPEIWQDRLYGLLQRIVLVTGSFIAASKTFRDKDDFRLQTASEDSPSIQNPHYTRPPGPLFTAAPYLSTRLSPFYLGTPPDLEACKADAETEVMINALRRLSSLPAIVRHNTPNSSPRSNGSRRSNNSQYTGQEQHGPQTWGLCDDLTSVLLADTDSYIVSLLFRPPTLPRDLEVDMPRLSLSSPRGSWSSSVSSKSPSPPPTQKQQQQHDNMPPQRRRAGPGASWSSGSASASATSSRSHSHPTQPQAQGPFHPFPHHPGLQTQRPQLPLLQRQPRRRPYSRLRAELFPSSSRAAATAAYLYLHVVLRYLWHPREGAGGIDGDLLHYLVETLRADVAATEEAMRIGAYSSEMWLWKVVVAAYAIAAVGQRDWSREGAMDVDVDDVDWEGETGNNEDEEEPVVEDMIDDEGNPSLFPSEYLGTGPTASLWRGVSAWRWEMATWFAQRIRAWSRSARVRSWDEARKILFRISWLDGWDGEQVVEALWFGAMAEASREPSPMEG